MSGSRPWAAEDRTGGPLDSMLDRVRSAHPDVSIERMIGSRPADDDNVYWIRLGSLEIQVDTAPDGAPPFVVEGELPNSRLDTSDPDRAWRHIVDEIGGR